MRTIWTAVRFITITFIWNENNVVIIVTVGYVSEQVADPVPEGTKYSLDLECTIWTFFVFLKSQAMWSSTPGSATESWNRRLCVSLNTSLHLCVNVSKWTNLTVRVWSYVGGKQFIGQYCTHWTFLQPRKKPVSSTGPIVEWPPSLDLRYGITVGESNGATATTIVEWEYYPCCTYIEWDNNKMKNSVQIVFSFVMSSPDILNMLHDSAIIHYRTAQIRGTRI